ncbi:hypothetical protein ACIRPH_31500 [Nocardiopsis sp. NPDC101807]|uniref:hypothetical protein n=1 Tax=Nocardiopsis sp. NPDC101807 TaxID=3364339 RepID=UPI003808BCF0
MAETTEPTTAPAPSPETTPSTAPAMVTEPRLEEIRKPDPKPTVDSEGPGEGAVAEDTGSSGEATEGSDDSGGGYVGSSDGGSYASDIAMMRQEAEYTETQVIPHLELLISQAERVGNGPATIQAVRAGLDAARQALGSARDAIAQVQATSEPVQAAYDNTGGEAAKSKEYFHGD